MRTEIVEEQEVVFSTTSTRRWSFLIYSMMTAHHLAKLHWSFKICWGYLKSGGTPPGRSILPLPSCSSKVCQGSLFRVHTSQCDVALFLMKNLQSSKSCKYLRIKISSRLTVHQVLCCLRALPRQQCKASINSAKKSLQGFVTIFTFFFYLRTVTAHWSATIYMILYFKLKPILNENDIFT